MSNNSIGAKGNGTYMEKPLKSYRVLHNLHFAGQHKINTYIIQQKSFISKWKDSGKSYIHSLVDFIQIIFVKEKE